MATIREVDSFMATDSREAALSSRLASLGVTHADLYGPGTPGGSGSSATASYLTSPLGINVGQRATPSTADVRARAGLMASAFASGGMGSSGYGLGLGTALDAAAVVPAAVTAVPPPSAAAREREMEELAEQLRERERALEQKLKEKRSTEAVLMRRVEHLLAQNQELERSEAALRSEINALKEQHASAASESGSLDSALREANNKCRKLEFQIRQLEESEKALTQRLQSEAVDKAARWKEYSSVERSMQDRMRMMEQEEFRLQEKLRNMESKLELNAVKLSEMVARETQLLAQLEDYRSEEERMADGIRATEERAKSLADSLSAKESSESELLERLRQLEMRNGTLQLLLDRKEKMEATLKENESRLRADVKMHSDAEEEAQRQISRLDTERRMRNREIDDLRSQIEKLDASLKDQQDVAESLRTSNQHLSGSLDMERTQVAGLKERVTELEGNVAARDETINKLQAELADIRRQHQDAQMALVARDRSDTTMVEKERRFLDELKAAQQAELAWKQKHAALCEEIAEVRKSEAELAEGLNSLGSALTEKDNRIAQLQADCDAALQAKTKAAEELTVKTAMLVQAGDQVTAVQSRLKTLQALLWRQEKVETAMKEREALLEAQIAELREQEQAASSNLRDAVVRSRQLQAEHAGLEESERAVRIKLEKTEAALADAQAKLRKATESHSTMEIESRALTAKVSSLEASLADKSKDYSMAQQQYLAWQQACREAEDRIAQLEAEAVEMSEKLSRDSKTSASAKAQLWRTQQTEATWSARVQEQAKKLQDAEAQAAVLSKQLEEAHEVVARRHEEASGVIAGLKAEIDRHVTRENELLTETDDARRSAEILSSQIEELNSMLRKLQGSEDALSQRAKLLREQLDEKSRSEAALRAHVEELDLKLTAEVKARVALEAQAAQARADVEEAERRISDLESRVDSLTAQLREAVRNETAAAERERQLQAKLDEKTLTEQTLHSQLSSLASPRKNVLKNVATAIVEMQHHGPKGNLSALSTGPASPPKPSLAPRIGGLFHSAFSHPKSTAERHAIYKAIFDAVDTDGSGTVEFAELQRYIQTAPTRADLPRKTARSAATPTAAGGSDDRGAGSAMHTFGGGTAGTDGTAVGAAARAKAVDPAVRARFCRFFQASKGGLEAAFRRFDTDGNGTLSWNEFWVLADEVFLPEQASAAAEAAAQRSAAAQNQDLTATKLAAIAALQIATKEAADRSIGQELTGFPAEAVGGPKFTPSVNGPVPGLTKPAPPTVLPPPPEFEDVPATPGPSSRRAQASAAGADFAVARSTSDGHGMGFGETSFMSSEPIMSVVVPEDKPESKSPSGSAPSTDLVPLTPTPGSAASVTGFADLQLPESVMRLLSPAALKHIQAASTPVLPSTNSSSSGGGMNGSGAAALALVSTPMNGGPAEAVNDAALVPTAPAEIMARQEEVMLALRQREAMLDDEVTEVSASIEALNRRDIELSRQLLSRIAASGIHLESDSDRADGDAP